MEHWGLCFLPHHSYRRPVLLLHAKGSWIIASDTWILDPHTPLKGSVKQVNRLRTGAGYEYDRITTASWSTVEDYDSTIQELSCFQHHKPPRECGNSCIDYVELLLLALMENTKISSMTEFFRLKEEEYEAVQRNILGSIPFGRSAHQVYPL
jgi:hypothetical protein